MAFVYLKIYVSGVDNAKRCLLLPFEFQIASFLHTGNSRMETLLLVATAAKIFHRENYLAH